MHRARNWRPIPIRRCCRAPPCPGAPPARGPRKPGTPAARQLLDQPRRDDPAPVRHQAGELVERPPAGAAERHRPPAPPVPPGGTRPRCRGPRGRARAGRSGMRPKSNSAWWRHTQGPISTSSMPVSSYSSRAAATPLVSPASMPPPGQLPPGPLARASTGRWPAGAAPDRRVEQHHPGRLATQRPRHAEPPYSPLIDTSAMARVTPAADDGSRSRSLPMATTPLSMRWMVDAMVNSRTGPASSPPRIRTPSAPDGEVAADRVDAGVHTRRSTGPAGRRPPGPGSPRATAVPGTTMRARAPVPGPLLNPARTADAVEAVPARRAE